LSLVRSKPFPNEDIRSTKDGYLYLDPAKFAADFAADLPKETSAVMAISQVFVSTQDKALNPDLVWWMYKRAGADVTEIRASHAVYMSKPRAVVGVIEKAAAAAKQEKPATGFTDLGWRGHMKRFQGTCFANAAMRCSSASSTGL
jgi:hypothetical protein